jgi:transcriptional regulator with XRE-family HTH domain
MKDKINIEILKNYMKEQQLSKTEFCKQCKISMEVLNKILANDSNFGIVALFKIARKLNMQIHELFI